MWRAITFVYHATWETHSLRVYKDKRLGESVESDHLSYKLHTFLAEVAKLRIPILVTRCLRYSGLSAFMIRQLSVLATTVLALRRQKYAGEFLKCPMDPSESAARVDVFVTLVRANLESTQISCKGWIFSFVQFYAECDTCEAAQEGRDHYIRVDGSGMALRSDCGPSSDRHMSLDVSAWQASMNRCKRGYVTSMKRREAAMTMSADTAALGPRQQAELASLRVTAIVSCTPASGASTG